MLKPPLARGELRCVGATTLNEYKKYIEKDAALERRFQQTYVKEPTVEETVSILRGLKEKYEVHHGVGIKDSALVAAATLSERYITDRYLPDKAIDLIDEAASRIRIEIDSKPEEIDELDRRIIQLEIEREALRKEKEKSAEEKLKKLQKELSELQEKSRAVKLKWMREKELIESMNKLKEQIDSLKIEEQNAERRGDLGRVAEIRYGQLNQVQKEVEEKTKELAEIQKKEKMLKEEVDEEDVAQIVSKWTGIPVSKMLQGEIEKLIKMEEELKKRVVGQDPALNTVWRLEVMNGIGSADPYDITRVHQADAEVHLLILMEEILAITPEPIEQIPAHGMGRADVGEDLIQAVGVRGQLSDRIVLVDIDERNCNGTDAWRMEFRERLADRIGRWERSVVVDRHNHWGGR